MLENFSVLDLFVYFVLLNVLISVGAGCALAWLDDGFWYRVCTFLLHLAMRCAALAIVAFSTCVAVAIWRDEGWSWLARIAMFFIEAAVLCVLWQVCLNIQGVRRTLLVLFGLYD
jgi:hypothetical protein